MKAILRSSAQNPAVLLFLALAVFVGLKNVQAMRQSKSKTACSVETLSSISTKEAAACKRNLPAKTSFLLIGLVLNN